MRRRGVAGAALCAVLACAAGSSAAYAGEEGDGGDGGGGEVIDQPVPCSGAFEDTEREFTNSEISPPLDRMRIDEVQQELGLTGQGVTVAVIDSGVADVPQVATADPPEELLGGPITVEHGTVVASLIAGARRSEEAGMGIGVAPGAEILSVRIIGSPEPDDDPTGLGGDFETEDVVRALEFVAGAADERDIDIVNLSLTTPPAPELKAAVRAVQDAGVIVVAATGNRSAEGQEELPEVGGFEPVAPDPPAYPAAYPGVVGVTTYVPPVVGETEAVPEQYVLNSAFIDVAAPTLGGAAVAPDGSTCVVDLVASSWATAYVSGVLALMVEDARPGETPEQITTRLVESASGQPDQRSRLTGAGIVQPVEALTRELEVGPGGELQQADTADEDGGRADPPPLRADELEESRDDFRWWGLLAGAVLVGAVILRPLLRRIRRS